MCKEPSYRDVFTMKYLGLFQWGLLCMTINRKSVSVCLNSCQSKCFHVIVVKSKSNKFKRYNGIGCYYCLFGLVGCIRSTAVLSRAEFRVDVV